MKKLLLSLAALAFATTLFALQTTKIAKENISQDTIAKVDKVFHA
jgi:hypothetical protein